MWAVDPPGPLAARESASGDPPAPAPATADQPVPSPLAPVGSPPSRTRCEAPSKARSAGREPSPGRRASSDLCPWNPGCVRLPQHPPDPRLPDPAGRARSAVHPRKDLRLRNQDGVRPCSWSRPCRGPLDSSSAPLPHLRPGAGSPARPPSRVRLPFDSNRSARASIGFAQIRSSGGRTRLPSRRPRQGPAEVRSPSREGRSLSCGWRTSSTGDGSSPQSATRPGDLRRRRSRRHVVQPSPPRGVASPAACCRQVRSSVNLTPQHGTTRERSPQRGTGELSSSPVHEIRRRPTLPGTLVPSTIGAGGLNFRVRDGNGCDPSAMATERSVVTTQRGGCSSTS